MIRLASATSRSGSPGAGREEAISFAGIEHGADAAGAAVYPGQGGASAPQSVSPDSRWMPFTKSERSS